MSPKRGDDVAPPPVAGEWRLLFATSEAAKGWSDLCTESTNNTRRCFEALRRAPEFSGDPDRQHRLGGRPNEFPPVQYGLPGKRGRIPVGRAVG